MYWSVNQSQNIRQLLFCNSEVNKHTIASQIQANGVLEVDKEKTGADVAVDALLLDLARYGTKVPAQTSEISSTVDDLLNDDDLDDEKQSTKSPQRGVASEREKDLAPEKVVFRYPVSIITLVTNGSGGRSLGTLEVTTSKMTYTRNQEDQDLDLPNSTSNSEFLWACRSHPRCSWATGEIKYLMKRQYLMQPTGVEVFFTSFSSTQSSVFFSFETAAVAKGFFYAIKNKCRPRYFNPAYYGTPEHVLQRNLFSSSGGYKTLTAAWQNRELSNFDYLLALNMIAGRSFNDLSQYPVFPWVLADYTSKTLDLKNPASFRNLHYPIKAQLPQQRSAMQEKYQLMLDEFHDASVSTSGMPCCPPRHTGSHFSTPGHVIWFLLRLEPFTSLHVWFMNGKFDKPDRLFDSVRDAYEGSVGENLMDVKELIPEFFYNAEFLENVNGIDLGVLQSGRRLGSVVLPPWANNANDFVRIHREALESDHVSRNLHAWIDLVFGFSQRPPHILGGSESCVSKCNVFCNIAYRDAVDLKALAEEDPLLYTATIRQISEFGQVPAWCFRDRHAMRRTLLDLSDVFLWPLASCLLGADSYVPSPSELAKYDQEMLVLHKPKRVVCIQESRVSLYPVLFIAESESDHWLVTVDVLRIVGLHVFHKQPLDSQPPYSLKIDRRSRMLSEGKQGAALMSLSERMMTSAGIGPIQRIRVVGIELVCKDSCEPMTTFPVETVFYPVKKQEVVDREAFKRLRKMSSDSGLADRKLRTEKRGKRNPSLSEDRGAVATDGISSTGGGSGRPRSQSCDSPLDHLSSQLFALLPRYHLLFSAGHYDCSIRVTAIDSGKPIQSVLVNDEVVTCLALTEATDCQTHWLVSGSKDTSVAIWRLHLDEDCLPMDSPVWVMRFHESPIVSIAVHANWDVVISGSSDGTVLLHKLRDGAFIRSVTVISPSHKRSPLASLSSAILTSGSLALPHTSGGGMESGSSTPPRHRNASETSMCDSTPADKSLSHSHSTGTTPEMHRISMLIISSEPYFVVYSQDGNMLFTYSINGRLLTAQSAGERLYAMCLSEDGKVLLTGGSRCLVLLRWVSSLKLADDQGREGLEAVLDGATLTLPPFGSPVRSLFLTNKEAHLVVGLETGHIRVLVHDSEYLRVQLHTRLQKTGFLR